MASLDIPFEDQLLALAALELLNDRTTYRYTALYTVNDGGPGGGGPGGGGPGR